MGVSSNALKPSCFNENVVNLLSRKYNKTFISIEITD